MTQKCLLCLEGNRRLQHQKEKTKTYFKAPKYISHLTLLQNKDSWENSRDITETIISSRAVDTLDMYEYLTDQDIVSSVQDLQISQKSFGSFHNENYRTRFKKIVDF